MSTEADSPPAAKTPDALDRALVMQYLQKRGAALPKGDPERERCHRRMKKIGDGEFPTPEEIAEARNGTTPPKKESVAERIFQHFEKEQKKAATSDDDQKKREISQKDFEAICNPGNPRLVINLPDNVVSKYIDAKRRTTDAYPEYHHASVLALLATVINKRASLDLTIGIIYPNVWVFTLGRSTVSRKTTACDYCRELIFSVIQWAGLSYPGSPEAFIEDIEGDDRVDGQTNRGHGILIRDEAAGLLASMQRTYMADMRDTLCQLYDGRPFTRKLRTSQRRKKSLFVIEDPYLNLYFATTPEAFKEHSSTSDILSGWLIRFIYYFPDYDRKIQPIRGMDADARARHKEIFQCLADLKHFFDSHQVHFRLSIAGQAHYNAWLMRHEETMQKSGEEDRGAFGRLSIYALKIAMLYTVGKSSFLQVIQGPNTLMKVHTIDIDDDCLIEACEEIEEYFLPVARLMIGMVGRNEDKNYADRVLGTIKRAGGKMTRRELLKNTHIRSKDLEDALTTLNESGEVMEHVIVTEKGKYVTGYRLMGAGEES